MNYENKNYHIQKKSDAPHVNIKISWKDNIFPTIHVFLGMEKDVKVVH